MNRVGFVTHESSLEHETPAGHPERAERIRAILDHLDASGVAAKLHHHQPDRADLEACSLAHRAEHIEMLQELDRRGGGRVDLDTSMGPHSLDAALRAVQGTIDGTRDVLDGRWDSAFVSMRPPGHHARPTVPMGFCLLNHVSIAARWAQQHGDAQRIAIVDWDAHHGNGTQEIFYDDPTVLYASLHQYPWYPGTGDATERGEGRGSGFTINVPLPAGTGEDAYDRALSELIEPRIIDFAPDLVFVSAGYDAHHLDPLCMMRLSSSAFFRFAQRIAEWGRGPVCVLEGGYDLDGLATSVAGTISALLGDDSPSGVPEDELGALEGTDEAYGWIERALEVQRGR